YRLETPPALALERDRRLGLDQDFSAQLGGPAGQVRGARGVKFGRRLGPQHLVEELARQVRLEGLVRLFQGVDVEDEIVHCGFRGKRRTLEAGAREVKAFGRRGRAIPGWFPASAGRVLEDPIRPSTSAPF